MKKRLFAVLLSLVALGLMAGSAMASETLKFTLNATVNGESALSEEISFDPSKVALLSSGDVVGKGVEDGAPIRYPYAVKSVYDAETKTWLEVSDPSLLGENGTMSKDIIVATKEITVSALSDKVKFSVGDKNDGEVLDTDLDKNAIGFYEYQPAGGYAWAQTAKFASGIEVKTFKSSTKFYIPVSVKTEKKTASKVTIAADKVYEEYNGGKSVVFVAVKVNFKATVEDTDVELPKAFTGRMAAYNIYYELTPDQRTALSNKGYSISGDGLNLYLNKSIANELGYAVDDITFNGSNNPATASEAKKVMGAGVDGVAAVMPQGGFPNKNTSAYVFAPSNLSDEVKDLIADGSANLYFLDLTKTHAGASVAEYGKAEEAQDVIFLIYDADAAEFRAPEEGDTYDYVFIAFSREPGTYQPFLATGEAPVDPSNPSNPGELSNPSEPSTPGSPSTPESPSSPSSPSETSNPSNPSGSSKPKSSGSSGCDMGMVSGLAVLLAALLPLRRVRR